MTSQARQLLQNQAKELAAIILGSSPTVQSVPAPTFAQGSQGLQLLQGVVTNTPDPGYVDVAFGGSSIPIPYLRHLDAYNPQIGDVVWVVRKGVDSVVLGSLRNVFSIGSTVLETPTVVGAGGGAPAFTNTWVQLASGGVRGQFWKDPDGIVHMTGIIQAGASSNGASAFTLPTEYRPYQECIFSTINANNNNPVKLRVLANGQVIPSGVATGDQVILGGICFPGVLFDLGRLRPLALQNGLNPDTTISTAYGPSAFVRDDGWVLLCGGIAVTGVLPAVGSIVSLVFADAEATPRLGLGQQLCYFQTSAGAHSGQFGRFEWKGATISIPGSTAGNEFFSLEGVNFMSAMSAGHWINMPFSNSWTNFNVTWYGTARYMQDKYNVTHIWGTLKPGSTTTSHFFAVPINYRRNDNLGSLPNNFYRAYGFGTFQGVHKITYTGSHNVDPAGVSHTTADALALDGIYWRTDEASDVGYV